MEAPVNAASAKRNTRLVPILSPITPKPDEDRQSEQVAVTTHSMLSAFTWKSRAMVGSATFTMVESKMFMNIARRRQRRRRGADRWRAA